MSEGWLLRAAKSLSSPGRVQHIASFLQGKNVAQKYSLAENGAMPASTSLSPREPRPWAGCRHAQGKHRDS